MAILAALALGAGGPAAAGDGIDARDREWFATAYAGQFVTSNLVDLPLETVRGAAEFEDAFFLSGALSWVFLPSIRSDLPLVGGLLTGSSLELEGQLGRQFGRQDHWEASLAVLWRTPDIRLPGDARLNLAFGEGLSWASSNPRLEGVIHGSRPKQFLNYLALEAELRHPAAPGVAIVPRIHHRSGIFGLIAPQKTGSNFVGVGVRVDLR